MDTTKELAKKNLFVETILGRKLHVAAINDSNGLRRQAAERAAINAPLQGSAADIIKKAMIDVDHWIGNDNPNIKMIMQVHDELVFECPKDNADKVMKKMKDTMEQTVELNIPFVTTMAGARMEVLAIAEAMDGIPEPRLLEIGTL